MGEEKRRGLWPRLLRYGGCAPHWAAAAAIPREGLRAVQMKERGDSGCAVSPLLLYVTASVR